MICLSSTSRIRSGLTLTISFLLVLMGSFIRISGSDPSSWWSPHSIRWSGLVLSVVLLATWLMSHLQGTLSASVDFLQLQEPQFIMGSSYSTCLQDGTTKFYNKLQVETLTPSMSGGSGGCETI